MAAMKKNFRKKKGPWYEKYLPFIARGRERQIDWLTDKLRKKNLSSQEITPYVKLLLEEDDPEGVEKLRELLAQLPNRILIEMLVAADIYDTAKLLALLPTVTSEHAAVAMSKTPPPYEHSPSAPIDRIFQVIHEISGTLLEEGAVLLRNSNEIPDHFEGSFLRFKEILRDQELLSTLYPKARS